MNKKFDMISMVSIIVLTIILVAFVFNYFTNSDIVSNMNYNNSPIVSTDKAVENLSGSNTFLTSTPVDSKKENQTENTSIIQYDNTGEIMVNSGEVQGIQGSNEITTNPISSAKDEKPVIITSNDNVSDQEKKEVLRDLDATLMDLLDVIDNVKTVDESRLPTDGSEVQP